MTGCCRDFEGWEAKCVYNIRGRDGVTIWDWRATGIGTVCPEPGEFPAKPLVMLIQSGQQVCLAFGGAVRERMVCSVYSTSDC
jgi:hypothetical protein